MRGGRRLRPVETETARCPEGTAFERSYPGLKDQVRQVRRDLAPVVDGCPLADDLILLASDSLNLLNCSFGSFCRALVSAGWTGCRGLPCCRAGG